MVHLLQMPKGDANLFLWPNKYSHNSPKVITPIASFNTISMPASTFRQAPQLLQPETIDTSPECSSGEFTIAPKPTTAPKAPRRSVQFKETVSVRPIRHVNAMCDDEIANVWYCRSEFDRMKRSFAATVKMITIGLYEGDDDHHCARGLEFRTRAGALKRRGNKLNALNAVLDEQDRQREHNSTVDEERIRKVYVNENLHCRLSALELGLHDRDEAQRLEDESTASESSSDSDSSEDEMDYCDMYRNPSLTRAPQRKITSCQRMVE